jgi:hypothetical protein
MGWEEILLSPVSGRSGGRKSYLPGLLRCRMNSSVRLFFGRNGGISCWQAPLLRKEMGIKKFVSI